MRPTRAWLLASDGYRGGKPLRRLRAFVELLFWSQPHD
jgi:hypothetical protein